mmetsp:Transcript_26217/g.104908  ORF Transcript_26217/g.104908 Transcript_26217/m.104908 type:complete len:371 (-) Transcript_26217:587-1699(-)
MGTSSPPKSAFAVIGCGLPGRGMGWFHALQLMEGACPSGLLSDVVEPWFLGPGKASAGGEAFEKGVVEAWAPKGVAFHASVEGIFEKTPDDTTAKIALIAGRTVDNPKFFRQALAAGATHILLEKPGAPTVEELEAMAAEAQAKGVPVFMGFVKNIAAYVTNALEASKAHATDTRVLFESRNNYAKEDLEECFARNAEGLLKNMAIHELALAAQFFGMRADNVAAVKLEGGPTACECLTLGGRTDFSRVDATLVNGAGVSVRVVADRCSGDGCRAVVSDAASDETIYESELVDEAKKARVDARVAAHPDWLSYLLTQEDEYADLKERCAKAAASGSSEYPDAVATIDIAIQALKLAEYLTPLLQEKLKDA